MPTHSNAGSTQSVILMSIALYPHNADVKDCLTSRVAPWSPPAPPISTSLSYVEALATRARRDVKSPAGVTLQSSRGSPVSVTDLPKAEVMWSQPYLETCCRAALHRVYLCAPAGRPAGLADDPCLQRLSGLGLCCRQEDGRFVITQVGQQRHATEVLRLPADGAVS
jgi:hypothetical protein